MKVENFSVKLRNLLCMKETIDDAIDLSDNCHDLEEIKAVVSLDSFSKTNPYYISLINFIETTNLIANFALADIRKSFKIYDKKSGVHHNLNGPITVVLQELSLEIMDYMDSWYMEYVEYESGASEILTLSEFGRILENGF